MEVTIFENYTHIQSQTEISQILLDIKTGRHKKAIDNLRFLYSNGDKKEYSHLKKNLPAFTPSGKFKSGRKKELLEVYSGMIILDLDHLGKRFDDLRNIIIACQYTYSCFASPSNDGLKVLVKVDSDMTKHLQAFNQVKEHYENLLSVEIDKSGKDITRLCFVSNDPKLYHNDESQVFSINNEKTAINGKTKSIPENTIKYEVENLIERMTNENIDITSSYEDWRNIAFALESEFSEAGRIYFHQISKLNANYNYSKCDNKFTQCVKRNNSGITISSLFYMAKKYGLTNSNQDNKTGSNSKIQTKTTNKFDITEEFLSEHFDIQYNEVSNRYEYKEKEKEVYEELNEFNLYIHLQKNNIRISLSDLTALLRSDIISHYDPFKEYFKSLSKWDGKTDYIHKLTNYLISPDRERFDRHFKKWLVRAVRTVIDNNYHNKQALVLVSNAQNSGKSTYCRFICPPALEKYIAENIGTDKDSLIALTENFIINLDELSTANKSEINAFKSMFSKDKVKARLPYDKRTSNLTRRASFIGSTDRWEFLSDENGSVRWLCFEISSINWNYSSEINIDQVFAQAYALLNDKTFNYELTKEEIEENDEINRKYQVSTSERHLLIKYFKTADTETGEFMTSTDMQEYIEKHTTIKLKLTVIGKELKFLKHKRYSKRNGGQYPVWGYYVYKIPDDSIPFI